MKPEICNMNENLRLNMNLNLTLDLFLNLTLDRTQITRVRSRFVLPTPIPTLSLLRVTVNKGVPTINER